MEVQTRSRNPILPKATRRHAKVIEVLEARIAPAAVLVATLSDNTNSPIQPGGTIHYTEVILNAAGPGVGNAALNLAIANALDPNLTLVPGSLNVSPLALDDTFSAVGNTQLFVNDDGAATGTTPVAGAVGNIFANDMEFENDLGVQDTFALSAVGATAFTGSPVTISTTGGGSVTVSGDGTFVYMPAAGFTGADTFTYTIADDGVGGTNALSGTGTVTINVANRVWYVDNSGANGDGRSNSPFNSLAALSGATGPDAAGDIIYINTGSGNYTGGITLLNNQILHGENEVLVVGGFNLAGAGADPVITNAGGNGVTVAGGNTLKGFTVGNTAGFDIANTAAATVGALTVSNVILNGTGGLFRADSGGTLAVTLDSASTTSATGHGIHLAGATSGTFTVSAGAISGVDGTDLFVNGGTATISVAASITSNVGGAIEIANHGTNNVTYSGALNVTGGTGVHVHDNTGGTIAFTNATQVINTGTAAAVNLVNNTGATINFSGGALNIDTTGGVGFSATGGGTVSVTGASNSISTGTGTALNVIGTTIAASDLTFHDISKNGAGTGIILNNTGTSGNLVVTGDNANVVNGTNSSGGTIQNADVGISLTNTLDPSFTNVHIVNTVGSGVDGTDVTGFTFRNGRIHNSGTGGGVNTSNIAFNDIASGINNLDGAVVITGNVLTIAFYSGIQIYNESGTISNLTISNNTITGSGSTATSKGSGIQIDINGSAGTAAAVTMATVSSNTINSFASGAGIQFQGGNGAQGPAATLGVPTGTPGSGANIITITGNVIGNTTAVGGLGTNAIVAGVTGTGQGNFAITSNGTVAVPLQHFLGIGVAAFGGNKANVDILVHNNVINAADNIANSSGISVGSQLGGADATQNGTIRATISSNTVNGMEGNGILAGVTNSFNTGYFKIINNNVGSPVAGFRPGIRVESGSSVGDATVFLEISGNTSGSSGGQPGIGVRKQGTDANVNEFHIEGLSPSPANVAQTEAYITAQNPGSVQGPGNDGVTLSRALVISGNNFLSGNVSFLEFVPDDTTPTPLPVDPVVEIVPEDPGNDTGGDSDVMPVVQDPAPLQDGLLSRDELASLVTAAIQVWEATGLSAEQSALLRSIVFDVADFSGRVLGQASPGHIVLDSNGASMGWFVDSTPLDNSEFGSGDVYVSGHLDAFTTVLHEIGHVLGLEDTTDSAQSGELMYAYLHLGERRLPAAGEAEGAVPHADEGVDFVFSPINGGRLDNATGDALVPITLPPGKSITVNFDATLATNTTATSVSTRGTITASGGITVLTDDPDVGGTQATVTAVDLPDVSVAVGSAVAENGAGNLVYTFTRTGPNDFARTINFSIGGTAVFGTDYTQSGADTFNGTTGTVTFAAGSATAIVTLDPTADSTVELDETALLTVTAGTGYDVGVPSAATGTITNDDTATISLSGGAVTEGHSGTANLPFTVTLSNPVDVDTTVQFSTSNILATAGSDYTALTNQTVTILAGQTTATVNVVVSGDTLVERDETVGGTIATPGASGRAVTLGTTTAEGTITNDDSATVSISAGSVFEGHSGTTNLPFTVTLSQAADTDITVLFSTSDGTATLVNSDYVQQSGQLVTIPAGSLSATRNVVINGDSAVEGDETVNGTIGSLTTNGRNVSLDTATAIGTITNDDATVTLTVTPSSTAEDTGANMVYTFTRTGYTGGPLTVSFNVGGTATFTTDYTTLGAASFNGTTGTVTFVGTSATATISIDPVTDTATEGDETVELTLVNNAGYTSATAGAVTSTIVDDDTIVSVTNGTASAAENDAAGLVYTFTRTGDTTEALLINFTKGGTAVFSSDFSVTSSGVVDYAAGTVTIPAGSASVTITLVPVDDRRVEGAETNVVTLATGTGYAISGANSAVNGTFLDNDTATLSFTSGTSNALESAGTHNVSATLTINATGTGTIGLDSDLTANLTGTGGTAAVGGVDYALPGAPALTFLAGDYATSTAALNAALTITDDRLVEGNETAELGLSILQNIGTQASVGGTTAHTLTINDNDTATISFNSGTSTALESDGTHNVGATLTINATGTGTIGLASNLTVNLTSTGGTATGGGTDYTLPASPALTFAAGSYETGNATQNAAVTVIDDRLVEGGETAAFGLAIAQNIGTQASVGGTAAHTLTITDNDTATISFNSGTSTALESDGARNVGVTLTINATGTGTSGLASSITANLTSTGGTATGTGTDYTLPGSPAVTFAAGSYETGTATQNGAVAITDDRLVEGEETAALGLSIAQNIGTQASVGGTTAHTLTINDNDTATLSFTSGTSSSPESAGTHNVSTTLTINATGTGTIGLASSITANLTSTGGTATAGGTDYTLPGSPAVTFAAGSYETGTATQNGAVTITDDRLVEGGETAALGLSIVQNIGTQASVGGTTAHTLTINDNDTATISFNSGTSTALESAGTHNVGATLTINATGTGTIGLASNLTVNLTSTGGTATGGGTDYTLPVSPALTFASGSYETGTATQNATVTITDDRLVEGSETAALGLSIAQNIGTQASVGGTTAHTLTITDNDTATISFNAGTSTALESAGTHNVGATLTINATGTGTIGLASNLTVNLTSTGGTATGGGTDYTLPGSPAVTFAAGSYETGSATQNAAVTVIDDRLVEGGETAAFGLAIAQNIGAQASVGGTTAHTLTITDNDTATISFASGTSTALESAGTHNVGATLTINATGTGTIGLASNVTAHLASTGGTATGGGTDYTLPGSPAVTFAAGSYETGTATQNAAVAITDDRLVEGSETAGFDVSIVQNIGTQVSLGATTAHTLTITDNDTATIGFTTLTSSVTEGTATSPIGYILTINATGTGTPALARDVTFSVTTTGGSATGGGTDYTLPTTATFSAGALSGDTLAANVAITNDSIAEDVETANLGLAIGTDSTGTQITIATGASSGHVLTITDSDIDLKVTGIGPVSNVVAGSGANNLTYTFTVQNNGFIDATNITLGELFTLPAGVSYTGSVSVNGTEFPGTNAGGTWTIPVLPANGTATLTLNFTANSAVVHNSIAIAAGTIGGADQSLVNTGDDSATVNATIIRQSDLSIAKADSPDPVSPGMQLTYTIVVTNNGPSNNTSATITDTFPAGFSNVSWTAAFSAGGTGTLSGTGNINEVVQELPAGETVTYTVTGTVTAPANSTLTNTATITSAEDTNAENNSDSESSYIGGVDLQLTKTSDVSTLTPGSVVQYTLTYRNGGFVTATGVKLSEIIPANTTFDLANSTAGWVDGLGNPLTNGAVGAASFPIGELPVSETGATVIFAVRVNATVAAGAETIDNSAVVTDDGVSGVDINPGNNAAADSDPLIAAPDFVVTIADDVTQAVRGGSVIYTINYSNVGNQDAVKVMITQNVPAGSSFDFFNSSPGWSQTGPGTYMFSLLSLPAGAAAGSLDFAVIVDEVVDPATIRTLDATATIGDGGINGADPTPADNTDTINTVIYQGVHAVTPGVALPRKGPPAVVRVFDIATGVQIHSIAPYGPDYKDSIRVALGDINGDGFDDIITSTRAGSGQVRVFDGVTGARFEGAFAEIAAFPEAGARGAFVASGDVNGDGRDDIITGSGMGARGGGKVRVFDGFTGQLVSTAEPFGAKFRGGVRVAAGDVNGDSLADIIVSQGYGGNDVKVLSGVLGEGNTRETLQSLEIGGPRYKGGVFVATGDLDGDGRADLVVGRDRGTTIVETFVNGATTPTDSFAPFAPNYRLGARVAVGDVNLDGIVDIIVGSGGRNNSTVKVFSGLDKSVLNSFQAFPTHPTGALFVAGTSPVPVLRGFELPA